MIYQNPDEARPKLMYCLDSPYREKGFNCSQKCIQDGLKIDLEGYSLGCEMDLAK